MRDVAYCGMGHGCMSKTDMVHIHSKIKHNMKNEIVSDVIEWFKRLVTISGITASICMYPRVDLISSISSKTVLKKWSSIALV